VLTINADDLGIDTATTNRIINCFSIEKIDSASIMVFMSDSERAFELARANHLPIGLHLNFDQKFASSKTSGKLIDHQLRIAIFLKAHKFAQFIYNPSLVNSFNYVFQSQWDEYTRLYEEEPKRIDGHRHMHLCMNMLLSSIVPKGIQVRGNFTFYPGEKDFINRFYRSCIDRLLRSRFVCPDAFFSLKLRSLCDFGQDGCNARWPPYSRRL
jgi:chitin disaccharide deacetylase